MCSDQLRDTLGNLCALGHPVIDAIQLEFEANLLAGRDRVEEADLLEGHAALTLAAVSDDDVIERRLLSAAAGEPDSDHAGRASKTLTNCLTSGQSPPERGANYTENTGDIKGPRPVGR